jgi:hypothetical protein
MAPVLIGWHLAHLAAAAPELNYLKKNLSIGTLLPRHGPHREHLPTVILWLHRVAIARRAPRTPLSSYDMLTCYKSLSCQQASLQCRYLASAVIYSIFLFHGRCLATSLHAAIRNIHTVANARSVGMLKEELHIVTIML